MHCMDGRTTRSSRSCRRSTTCTRNSSMRPAGQGRDHRRDADLRSRSPIPTGSINTRQFDQDQLLAMGAGPLSSARRDACARCRARGQHDAVAHAQADATRCRQRLVRGRRACRSRTTTTRVARTCTRWSRSTARDATGTVLATTMTVLPVSDEMHLRGLPRLAVGDRVECRAHGGEAAGRLGGRSRPGKGLEEEHPEAP